MEETVWLKTLEGAVEEAQQIPLWGMPPSFPWENFSEALATSLEQKISVAHHTTQWLGAKDFKEGMGKDPFVQPFTLSPLTGTLFLIVPKQSYIELVEHLLTKDQSSKGFSDPSLQEGFFQFTLANICQSFNELNPFGNLIASLAEEEPLPDTGALCIDISITVDSTPLWGRIIVPSGIQAGFQNYFAMEKPPLLSDPSFANTPLSLHLDIGSTTLPVKQWEKIDVGDFLLLDRCTYDLEHNRGTAMMLLGTSPLFDVRIKEGEIKILEHALYQEESSMTDENSNEETPPSEEMNGDEKPMWSTNGEEESESLLSSKEVPLTLTVEAGRFQMPLQKLTKLKPGNVLDLNLSPKLGVYLTIGGKRVAKGELIQLGEGIGVKILNLGD